MRTRLAGLVLALGLAASTAVRAEISVSFSLFAPPPLPVYVQPPMPAAGYLWAPGYWAWSVGVGDYYWVPGTWVRPPRPGYLWTPGYWGWNAGQYRWNAGYWATRVGFYGGINYGFGYVGSGYQGGHWDRGTFRYNTAVNNINTTVVKNVEVYNTKVVNVTDNARNVSYNGGTGGVDRKPTREEDQVKVVQHMAPTKAQAEHDEQARQQPSQRASVNKGRPEVASTAAPKGLNGPGAGKTTNPESSTASAGAADKAGAEGAAGATDKNASRDNGGANAAKAKDKDKSAGERRADSRESAQATASPTEGTPKGGMTREERDAARAERDTRADQKQRESQQQRQAVRRGQPPVQQEPHS